MRGKYHVFIKYYDLKVSHFHLWTLIHNKPRSLMIQQKEANFGFRFEQPPTMSKKSSLFPYDSQTV